MQFLRSVIGIVLFPMLGLGTTVACTFESTIPDQTHVPEPTPPPAVPHTDTVSVLGVWGGTELESFYAMIEPWEIETGYSLDFEGGRDLAEVLRRRIDSGDPPDIAIVPNPALMEELAKGGHLRMLDQMIDMTKFRKDYTRSWRDLGSVDRRLYGVFIKATDKSTIWHSPPQFLDNGYAVPDTWDGLIGLSDQMVEDGRAPWSLAMESNAASGWPAADWIAQIILSTYGPDFYDRWVAHEISWLDPRIREAFDRFGQIALNEEYVAQDASEILSMNFAQGSHLLFVEPPQAYMHYISSGMQGDISRDFPDQVPGEDYDYFDFPVINDQYAGFTTVGADLVIAFREHEAVQSLIQHLASASAQTIWAQRGGYTSVNQSVDLESYPDQLSVRTAERLIAATNFRIGAGDMMPSSVQEVFWKGMLDYLRDSSDLDKILERFEAAARDEYRNQPRVD